MIKVKEHRKVMYSNRLVARVVGILFIIGTISGILSAVLTGPILNDSNYLTKIISHEPQIILGSIFVLIMAFALATIPIVLFPIFRKYNETLALGAVVFRGVLETVLYIAIAVGWMLLIVVGREYAGATNTGNLHDMGVLLQAAEDWNIHILAIVFSLGALMIYWLFYVSKLIPRWLAVWGLVGAVLYLVSPLFAMFGVQGFGVLMAPLALQEMVLALWLIIKGFNSRASTSLETTKIHHPNK